MEKEIREAMNDGRIKALPAHYRGTQFRSRTEASWAAFFDSRSIEWEYEKEGFELSDGTWYLPDFWLPQVKMWAEVKGGEFSEDEIRKCDLLAIGTGFPCLMLNGRPRAVNYWACEPKDPDGRSDGKMDYVLTNGRNYHLTEARFYANTGASYPAQRVDCWDEWEAIKEAYVTFDRSGLASFKPEGFTIPVDPEEKDRRIAYEKYLARINVEPVLVKPTTQNHARDVDDDSETWLWPPAPASSTASQTGQECHAWSATRPSTSPASGRARNAATRVWCALAGRCGRWTRRWRVVGFPGVG